MAHKSTAPVLPSHDYQAEDDHHTLSRAAEIRSDPKRVAAVQQHHQTVKKRLSMVGRSLRRSLDAGKR